MPGDAKEIADRFISRGGRTPSYDRAAYVEDLIDVSSFLAWAEQEGETFGGVSAGQAFRAMYRLVDVDVIGLRKAAMGEA